MSLRNELLSIRDGHHSGWKSKELVFRFHDFLRELKGAGELALAFHERLFTRVVELRDKAEAVEIIESWGLPGHDAEGAWQEMLQEGLERGDLDRLSNDLKVIGKYLGAVRP